MQCYNDKTYCASPDCSNKCGRMLTEQIKREAAFHGVPLCLGYFCGYVSVKDEDTTKEYEHE